MTTFQLYWLTRLDSLNSFLVIMACLSGLALIIAPFAAMMADVSDNDEQNVAGVKRYAKWAAGTLVCTLALSVFVPSTADLIAIYGISFLTQNKDAREIPAEALKVLNQKLKELSEEEKK